MSTPTTHRDFRLIDSTLRDGSHAISHQYTEDDVISIVKGLDAAGVEVIEIAHGDQQDRENFRRIGETSFKEGGELITKIHINITYTFENIVIRM